MTRNHVRRQVSLSAAALHVATLDPAAWHEHAIAKDTVKNPLKGVFLGGPNAVQAEATLRSRFGYNDAKIAKLKGDFDKREYFNRYSAASPQED